MLSTLNAMTAVYAPRLFTLLNDRKGVSAMEYAVLAVAIVAAVAAGGAVLAKSFGGAIGTVSGEL